MLVGEGGGALMGVVCRWGGGVGPVGTVSLNQSLCSGRPR